MMTILPIAALNPWNDPVDLLLALGQLEREHVTTHRDAVVSLATHQDLDVQEETLRVLLVRWKLSGLHPLALDMLVQGETPEIRIVAAFGIAVTSSEVTRLQDTAALKVVLTNLMEDEAVRQAACEALLILFRRPAFPSEPRAFDADRDVDWAWVEQLPMP